MHHPVVVKNIRENRVAYGSTGLPTGQVENAIVRVWLGLRCIKHNFCITHNWQATRQRCQFLLSFTCLGVKCLPVLLYGLEACPISNEQFKSLDFVLNG